MGYWSGAIRADGLIYGPDFSPAEPDEEIAVQNAQAALGGENWLPYLFSQGEAETILNALPGRCWLIGGEIVARQAPTLTLSGTVIDTLRPEGITAEIDVHADDTDTVQYKLSYPSGLVTAGVLALAEGVASLEIHTKENGVHSLEIVSIECGTAHATFEAREMKPTPFVQTQLDNYHRGYILTRTPKPSLLDERTTSLWQQI